jgi:hypothetical protein
MIQGRPRCRVYLVSGSGSTGAGTEDYLTCVIALAPIHSCGGASKHALLRVRMAGTGSAGVFSRVPIPLLSRPPHNMTTYLSSERWQTFERETSPFERDCLLVGVPKYIAMI